MPATLRRIDAENDEFQLAHSLLSNRRQRHRQSRFVVQGVRPLERALAAGWRVDAIWYAQGRPLSRWAQGVLARAGARSHVEAAPELLAELSERDEPSELVAIVEIPPDDLERIRARDPALVVLLDRPASPGNLGSVVRSADAFGADGARRRQRGEGPLVGVAGGVQRARPDPDPRRGGFAERRGGGGDPALRGRPATARGRGIMRTCHSASPIPLRAQRPNADSRWRCSRPAATRQTSSRSWTSSPRPRASRSSRASSSAGSDPIRALTSARASSR